MGRRYRRCPDPKEKARWHLTWLLLRPSEPSSCERATPLVGLFDVYARAALKRWNARGPAGLADRRKANRSPGRLTAPRQEPPDGGLWSGPKVAAYVRDRWGVEVCPQTGWRWLKRLGFRLVVPRPRHPKAATPEQHRLGLQPVARRVCALGGTRPASCGRQRYQSLYVSGFARPATGLSLGLLPKASAALMGEALAEFACWADPGAASCWCCWWTTPAGT